MNLVVIGKPERSIVRENLLTREGYAPYCGNGNCWHRAHYKDGQFHCTCGWVSEFPKEFIDEYKKKWNK